MSKRIDITGNKYNMLTAINYSDSNNNGDTFWLFKCECGNTKIIKACEVKRGKVKSCGCLYSMKYKDVINCKYGIVGIYAITNKINNKVYYGSSKDMRLRLISHCNKLDVNKHRNELLQSDWNKYGRGVFKLEVVMECKLEDLLKLEQAYIKNNKNVYNVAYTDLPTYYKVKKY